MSTLLVREPGDLASGRAAECRAGPCREGEEPNPMMNGGEKSDPAVVAGKPANKAERSAAEPVERRAGAEEKAGRQSTHRTQTRDRVTQALDRIREAARQREKEQFTALLHHVNPDTLRLSFYALKRQAAPGIDGMTWRDYEADLGGPARRSARTGPPRSVSAATLAPELYRRTGSSGRWRSPPWRTRSSKAPWSWC